MRICLNCNKNLTHIQILKKCKYCCRKCFYKSRKGILPKNIQTLYTDELNENRRQKLLGEKSTNWLGDKVGYQGIHRWLRLYHKKKGICEKCRVKKITEWALIKGLKYERKRKNFKELCRKCHIKYDNAIHRGWETKHGNQKTLLICR